MDLKEHFRKDFRHGSVRLYFEDLQYACRILRIFSDGIRTSGEFFKMIGSHSEGIS